jgi:hypothetical protein
MGRCLLSSVLTDPGQLVDSLAGLSVASRRIAQLLEAAEDVV